MHQDNLADVLEKLWQDNNLPYTSLIINDIHQSERVLTSFFQKIISLHGGISVENNHDIIFLKLENNKSGEVQKNISVSLVRNMQAEFANRPIISPYRFAVILGGEYLNQSSANSLLKILEDGPESTYFFIVTEDENKLLKTIKSRAIEIYVKKNNTCASKLLIDDICKILNPEVRFEDKEKIISNIADMVNDRNNNFLKDIIDAISNVILGKDVNSSMEYVDFRTYIEGKKIEDLIELMEYSKKMLEASKFHNLDSKQILLIIISKFYNL